MTSNAALDLDRMENHDIGQHCHANGGTCHRHGTAGTVSRQVASSPSTSRHTKSDPRSLETTQLERTYCELKEDLERLASKIRELEVENNLLKDRIWEIVQPIVVKTPNYFAEKDWWSSGGPNDLLKHEHSGRQNVVSGILDDLCMKVVYLNEICTSSRSSLHSSIIGKVQGLLVASQRERNGTEYVESLVDMVEANQENGAVKRKKRGRPRKDAKAASNDQGRKWEACRSSTGKVFQTTLRTVPPRRRRPGSEEICPLGTKVVGVVVSEQEIVKEVMGVDTGPHARASSSEVKVQGNQAGGESEVTGLQTHEASLPELPCSDNAFIGAESDDGEDHDGFGDRACDDEVIVAGELRIQPMEMPHACPTDETTSLAENGHHCKLCLVEFADLASLEEHLSTHGSGEVSCWKCHAGFHNLALLLTHNCSGGSGNHGHRPGSRLPRLLNEPSFPIQQAVGGHKHEQHRSPTTARRTLAPAAQLRCDHCQGSKTIFRRYRELFKHYARVHADGKPVCLLCGYFCTSTNEYADHMARHKETTALYCKKCTVYFMDVKQLQKHCAEHKQCRCLDCGALFATHSTLVGHRKTAHHMSKSGSHRCTRCNQEFTGRQQLTAHMKTHTTCPVDCVACSLTFKSKESLRKHQRGKHHQAMLAGGPATAATAGSQDRGHLCAICGKAYKGKTQLTRHMKYHVEDKPYQCPHCAYQCRDHNNLKRHIALHFSSREFVCEQCGDGFHAKRTLDIHVLYKHLEQRQFKCPRCDWTFKTHNSLTRHMRSHSDRKPYACTYCSASFNRQHNLRRHMKSVHGSEGVLPPPNKVRLLDVPEGLEYVKGTPAVTGKLQIAKSLGSADVLTVKAADRQGKKSARRKTKAAGTEFDRAGLVPHMDSAIQIDLCNVIAGQTPGAMNHVAATHNPLATASPARPHQGHVFLQPPAQEEPSVAATQTVVSQPNEQVNQEQSYAMGQTALTTDGNASHIQPTPEQPQQLTGILQAPYQSMFHSIAMPPENGAPQKGGYLYSLITNPVGEAVIQVQPAAVVGQETDSADASTPAPPVDSTAYTTQDFYTSMASYIHLMQNNT